MTKIAQCPDHGLHGERDTCFVCGQAVRQVHMVLCSVCVSVTLVAVAVGILLGLLLASGYSC